MNQITQLIQAVEMGEQPAETLLPLVYEELRQLAAQKLSHEAPGQTLQPTALVHEAWLRLSQPRHTQILRRLDGKGIRSTLGRLIADRSRALGCRSSVAAGEN